MSLKVDKIMSKAEQSSSPWAPLGNRIFLILWLSTLFSNIGTWMHDVGSGWLMTNLSPSPGMIAAVQAMTTLPIFLLALPAGAIADIVDKRKMIIAVNIVMLLAASLLTVLVYTNTVTISGLLIITFVLGACTAFLSPAWQAIVPSIIDAKQLKAGIALNSMGINVSRALGPAIAGVLIAQVGLYVPFLFNAISFLGIIIAVWWWKGEEKKESTIPAETAFSAMIAGVRYARRSPALLGTIFRAVCFFVFASAYWAMLPLVARQSLQGDASLYGILMGSVGIGAVCGALFLPKLRERFSTNVLVVGGTLGTALVLLIFALAHVKFLAVIASFLAGASWIAVLSSFMISAQTALPNWVRARGLALYLMAFSGAMALGSLGWGQIASHSSVSIALLIAAAGIILVLPITLKVELHDDSLNLAPSMHWSMSPIVEQVKGDRGPVMVYIEYTVPEEQSESFLQLIKRFKESRLRDGAFNWYLFQDPERRNIYIETFILSSWFEHLRQHERVTEDDKGLQQAIFAITGQPAIRHYISVH